MNDISWIRPVFYGVIGLVLSTGGITWRNWQFYAVMGLSSLACTIH